MVFKTQSRIKKNKKEKCKTLIPEFEWADVLGLIFIFYFIFCRVSDSRIKALTHDRLSAFLTVTAGGQIAYDKRTRLP